MARGSRLETGSKTHITTFRLAEDTLRRAQSPELRRLVSKAMQLEASKTSMTDVLRFALLRGLDLVEGGEISGGDAKIIRDLRQLCNRLPKPRRTRRRTGRKTGRKRR